ncbi:MAG: hypothetical protein JWP74_3251 [Marmoricola sp.]|nr:hypothetical protein [Marmoricola sp.]
MRIARYAAIATLILGLSACGSGSGQATKTRTSDPTGSSRPAAPTTQPAISGTGAVMPLKPSEPPLDWDRIELDGGAYSVSVPDGYEIIAPGAKPKDSSNIPIIATIDTAVPLTTIKSNSKKSGSFTPADGYVPANDIFEWPNSDGASYVRQNLDGVIATGFVINAGNKSLVFAASAIGPNRHAYDQNTVDEILSTARVN